MNSAALKRKFIGKPVTMPYSAANEGKPTIGTLARQLYNECQIKLCEHEVEILRKYSLFEEGDPYD